MTLSSCILITIPVCISAILMQTYFDSRKYKRIPHLIVLLSFKGGKTKRINMWLA